ncbi:microbial aspartic proteinase [Coniochaeta sp. 2T2.1]|nr:microbial aspartic proteinase [Coniochaeta sp. 2T2.1]
MLSTHNFLLVALLGTAGLGLALPPKIGTIVSEDSSPGRLSLKQVRNPKHIASGPLSVYKTYLKYNVPIPDYLHEAVKNFTIAKRATGSALAIPIDTFDDAYITPVSIGTPAQTLNLDFDTGSSDLWVFSSELPSSQVNGQTTIPDSGIEQHCGLEVRLHLVNLVTIGGLTVNGQAVEAAQTVSSSFTSDPDIDGLVGLGFDSLNTVSPTKQPTWFDNIKSSLDSPLFTADLKHNAPGHYNFGYLDSTAYTGAITYVAVTTSPGYWTWASSGYAIGSGSFISTSISGIAGTGTTLLYLPTTIVTAYYRQVSGSSKSRTYGGYVFPCSAVLPSFTFGVGSLRITIPASYMNYGPVTTNMCFGGLQSSSGIGINIFGDVALKAAFVVSDGGSTPRLGWAKKTL